jgi:hypothetical protein
MLPLAAAHVGIAAPAPAITAAAGVVYMGHC